jgi:D-3-phosphoglycerate dehydrogenase/C-terminal binding protein
MSREKYKVVIVDSISNSYVTEPNVELEILSDVADVTVVHVNSSDELLGKIDNADAVISWHLVPLPKSVIDRFVNCQVIVRAAVGFDNIDISAAHKKGIPVCNVPDYGTEEVADHALALMLSLARRIPLAHRSVLDGQWDWHVVGSLGRLRGKVLGIVGFGRTGSAVARRAHSFGLRVAFYDPYVVDGTDKAHGVIRYESLHQLLRDSDIISLHTPLSDETRHLIGEQEFACMNKHKILINTSRGEVIDQIALLEAIKGEKIAKVALDVLESEPEVPPQLCSSNDFILTPHSAFYCDEGLLEIRTKSAQMVLRQLSGQSLRTVVNGVLPLNVKYESKHTQQFVKENSEIIL